MTSRERVLTALSHRETDRVPLDVGSCGPTGTHMVAYRGVLDVLGIDEAPVLGDVVGQMAKPSETVLRALGSDIRGIRVGAPSKSYPAPSPDKLIDQWGTTWHIPEGGTCYSIIDYPLRDATRKDLDAWSWPDGTDPARAAGLRERARQLREETDFAVLGEVSGHILERAQMIRGFDRFYEDLAGDPGMAEDLLDRILQVEIDIAATFLDAVGGHLDVFAFKDDLGTQSGPLISPTMFRRLLKPRMARLIEVVRARTKARIWFHSCGSCYFAIRDLIDIGVEILNPVQVQAKHMDPVQLKKEFGSNLSFWGGIDTQAVLPFGTTDDVEREVRNRIQELGAGGGYVLASVHNIEADVPGANVVAMCRAAGTTAAAAGLVAAQREIPA